MSWPARTWLWAALYNMRFQMEQDRNWLNPEEELSTSTWVFPWYQSLPGSSTSSSHTPPPGVFDGLHLPYLYAVLSYLRLRCLFAFHHRLVVFLYLAVHPFLREYIDSSYTNWLVCERPREHTTIGGSGGINNPPSQSRRTLSLSKDAPKPQLWYLYKS